MTKIALTRRLLLVAAGAAGLHLLATGTARGHCDTLGGPVVTEGRAALETGDVTPLLKWVRPADEAEIKAAFAKARVVRSKGPEAKELADRFFLETLVRVHRAGEGAPYAGLKEEAVDPIVALAERSLADGNVAAVRKQLTAAMDAGLQEKLDRVLATRKHKDRSVAEGREYVRAYVTYLHYVEGLHAALLPAGGQQHGAAPADAGRHEAHRD